MPISEQRVQLIREPQDISRSRRWLADLMRDAPALDDEELGHALIMASELMTNVMLHTASEATLKFDDDAGQVRVSVHDDDPRLPVMRSNGAMEPGGNGLRIVDAWATSWGIERIPGNGKTIWFSIDR
ncbi:MAG: putative regulatory protein containing a conserved C-terminal domain (modular protein) [Acidimicrobiales bacterium]|nr:putative regulatory protein containing a conserved C-terminal domain (modular protein) [Acidimicrobiales bacterium]